MFTDFRPVSRRQTQQHPSVDFITGGLRLSKVHWVERRVTGGRTVTVYDDVRTFFSKFTVSS